MLLALRISVGARCRRWRGPWRRFWRGLRSDWWRGPWRRFGRGLRSDWWSGNWSRLDTPCRAITHVLEFPRRILDAHVIAAFALIHCCWYRWWRGLGRRSRLDTPCRAITHTLERSLWILGTRIRSLISVALIHGRWCGRRGGLWCGRRRGNRHGRRCSATISSSSRFALVEWHQPRCASALTTRATKRQFWNALAPFFNASPLRCWWRWGRGSWGQWRGSGRRRGGRSGRWRRFHTSCRAITHALEFPRRILGANVFGLVTLIHGCWRWRWSRRRGGRRSRSRKCRSRRWRGWRSRGRKGRSRRRGGRRRRTLLLACSLCRIGSFWPARCVLCAHL
jgi:hypothetical protein